MVVSQRIVNMNALTIAGPPLNTVCRGVRPGMRNSSSLRPKEYY